MKKLLFILFFPLLVFSQENQQRVALVIGNSAYLSYPLDNAVNDARLIDSTLTKVGFDVMRFENLQTNEDFFNAMFDFSRRLDSCDVGFIYYSGHGIEIGTSNYLVPVGVDFKKYKDLNKQEAYIKNQSFLIQDMMDYLKTKKKKLNIVILDACRVPVQAKGNTNKPSINKSSITVNSGTLLAFATRSGEPAEDGVGNNSAYCESLCRQILVPNLTLGEIFGNVRDYVEKNTSNTQSPIERSAISAYAAKNFIFIKEENTKIISLEQKLENAYIELHNLEGYVKSLNEQMLVNGQDLENDVELMETFKSIADDAQGKEEDIYIASLFGLMRVGLFASNDVHFSNESNQSSAQVNYAATLHAEATHELNEMIRITKKDDIELLLKRCDFLDINYQEFSYRIKIAYLIATMASEGMYPSFSFESLYHVINELNCNREELDEVQDFIFIHLLYTYIYEDYIATDSILCMPQISDENREAFFDMLSAVYDDDDDDESLYSALSYITTLSARLKEYSVYYKREGFLENDRFLSENGPSYSLFYVSYERALMNFIRNYAFALTDINYSVIMDISEDKKDRVLELIVSEIDMLNQIVFDLQSTYIQDARNSTEYLYDTDFYMYSDFFEIISQLNNNHYIATGITDYQYYNYLQKRIMLRDVKLRKKQLLDNKHSLMSENDISEEEFYNSYYYTSLESQMRDLHLSLYAASHTIIMEIDLNANSDVLESELPGSDTTDILDGLKESSDFLNDYFYNLVESEKSVIDTISIQTLHYYSYYKSRACVFDYDVTSSSEAYERIDCCEGFAKFLEDLHLKQSDGKWGLYDIKDAQEFMKANVVQDFWDWYDESFYYIFCDPDSLTSQDDSIDCQQKYVKLRSDYLGYHYRFSEDLHSGIGNESSLIDLNQLVFLSLDYLHEDDDFIYTLTEHLSNYTRSTIAMLETSNVYEAGYMHYMNRVNDLYFEALLYIINSNNIDYYQKEMLINTQFYNIRKFLKNYNFSDDYIGIKEYTLYKITLFSSLMSKVQKNMEEHGEVKLPTIGLEFEEPTIDLYTHESLQIIEDGVLIIEVIKGGASDVSGIKEGDILLSLNNIEIDSPYNLEEQISRYNPGDIITCEIKRENKKQIFNLVLQ